jgi:hypothetical protein
VLSQPTRIDLLELDIDLRLTDLWREAVDVNEWNLEVVAAFIRAAYGKGYCDALTEDSPGALCLDHGYRIPERPGEQGAPVGTQPADAFGRCPSSPIWGRLKTPRNRLFRGSRAPTRVDSLRGAGSRS